jgi:hypothetical protein
MWVRVIQLTFLAVSLSACFGGVAGLLHPGEKSGESESLLALKYE